MPAPKHVYVTYIRTSPDRLWDALGVLVEGDVLESSPYRRLVSTFDRELPDGEHERPSRVTFEIDPLGDVCRLTMVHDDFHGVTRTFAILEREWPRVLSDLKSRLETGAALEVPTAAEETDSSPDVVDVDVEDHREWGRRANNRCWELLGNEARTEADDREMVEVAYASAWHWRHAGTAVNEQRAEWMISRVHAVFGRGDEAQRHAERCWTITRQEALGDFDLAYAYEALYRAAAVRGDDATAREWYVRAEAAAKDIAEAEDRDIFVGDLALPVAHA